MYIQNAQVVANRIEATNRNIRILKKKQCRHQSALSGRQQEGEGEGEEDDEAHCKFVYAVAHFRFQLKQGVARF